MSDSLFDAVYKQITEGGGDKQLATSAANILANIDPIRSRTNDEQQTITEAVVYVRQYLIAHTE